MTTRQEILEVAKRMGQLEAEIAERQAEYERLNEKFAAMVPEAPIGKVASTQVATKIDVRPLPARVLELLAKSPGEQFTPKQVADALGVEAQPVRNALLRLSEVTDGRIWKPDHGLYRFQSLEKKKGAA